MQEEEYFGVNKERRKTMTSEKKQETIWDYKPTEEEIQKMCDELDLTDKSIITESRENENCRLACLCKLFKYRKNHKEKTRIINEFCSKQKIPFDTAIDDPEK